MFKFYIKKTLLLFHDYFVLDLVAYFPTKIGDLLRRFYVKLLAKQCGKNLVAHTGVQFFNILSLKIGNNVNISRSTIIDSSIDLSIGNNVMIGPYCNIMNSNHGFKDITVPMREQADEGYKLIINDNVWIGHGVVINSGSRPIEIAEGVIVSSNSVVTKDCLEKNAIYGGIPAKFIKFRCSNE